MTLEVDVYATGVLSDLLALGRTLNPWWLSRSRLVPGWVPRHPQVDELDRSVMRGWRRNAIRHRSRHLLVNVRRRKAWHGWHAEPLVLPPGLDRIGTGWTRARALADLDRRVGRAVRLGDRGNVVRIVPGRAVVGRSR